MNGTVVIGEGEKDEAPMLYNGEIIGDGTGPEVDVAVDPIDGTGLTSRGQGNALAVVALSERGTMFDPGPCVYMDKLVCGPEAADVVDLDAPPEENVHRVAKALGIKPAEVGVTILDRPRHEELIAAVRRAGARVFLITDGDVAGSINAAREETGVHLLLGIGGTPEGVISACAVKCLGGHMLGRLWPRNDDERARAKDAGYDLDQHPDRRRPRRTRTTCSSPRPASPTDGSCTASATRTARRSRTRWSCARAPGRSATSSPSTASRS